MRNTRFGDQLIAAAREALAHARGRKKLRERTVFIPDAARPWPKKKIAMLRKQRYGVSQPVFAAMLNVTPSTIRAWEQGQKIPSGAACRLLQIADLDPSVFEHLARRARSMYSEGRVAGG